MTDSGLTIMALDQGAAAAGLLAAHRSARLDLFGTVNELNRAVAKSDDPVLLSLADWVTFRQLSEIMRTAHEAGVPCGFIDAWRGQENGRRHAANVLAWSPCHEPGISFWNSIQPTITPGGSYANLDIVQHDTQVPVEVLGSARRTLGMITHGNGIESEFGSGLLCGLLTAPDGVRLENYFPCGQGGGCIRGAFVDGEFVNPPRHATSALGGDILVWATCANVLTSDALFDPRGGLLVGLLDDRVHRRARQVITMVRVVEVDDVAVLAACARIEAGDALGDVVTGLNEMYLRWAGWDTDPPWILYGDPTARVESGQSVTWASDGGAVAPGLSLFALPAGREEDAQPVLLVQDPAEVQADLWFARIGRVGEVEAGLLLRQDTGPEVTLTSTSPKPAELDIVRRQLAAVEALAFSDMLLRLAASQSPGTPFRYDPEVGGRVQETLQHLQALSLSPDPHQVIAGDAKGFTGLWAAEKNSWRKMNEELFRLVIQIIHTHGNIFFNFYNFVPPSPPDSRLTDCPYCGSPVELSVVRFPGPIAARQNLRCGRCAFISDADARCGSVFILGPELVTAGQAAQYHVTLGSVPGQGVEFGCAQLFARRQPWPFAETSTCAVIEDSAGTCGFALEWTPPADAQPGRYYLLAPVVIDGAVHIGRRPVLVTAGAGQVPGGQ